MAYMLKPVNNNIPEFECEDTEYQWLMLEVGFGEILDLKPHRNGRQYYWPWRGLDPMQHEGYWVSKEDVREMIKKYQEMDFTEFSQDDEKLLKEFIQFIKKSGGYEVY